VVGRARQGGFNQLTELERGLIAALDCGPPLFRHHQLRLSGRSSAACGEPD